jgi:hypothetical protein
MPTSVHRTFVLAALMGSGLALPARVSAQEQNAVAEPALQTVPDSVVPSAHVSPTTAFARAVLLPGWGHASIGSYSRGAFYFAAEISTGFGLLRTNRRLVETRDRIAFREATIRAEQAAQGVTDPEEIAAALEADAVLEDMDELLVSREDQQEDWAALGIFLLLLAGADAFVSAHLADFPAPITLDAAPLPGGRVEFAVSVKLPN